MSETRNPVGHGARPGSPNQPDYSTLLEEYQQPILNYLRRLTHNSPEADDLAQEVFLRLHQNLASFRGEASEKTWLYRIATNVFLDYTKRASTRHEKSAESVDNVAGGMQLQAATPRPDQVASKSEMSACVQDYVHTLPPTYSTVLTLHDVQGLTNREIAEALEITESTVKIRLHRARLRLKDKLNKGCQFSHDEEGTFVCDPNAGNNSD